MATSGEILGNNVAIAGGGGSYGRIRVEWQLASQNIAGNYSTINWQAYVDYFSGDAQLDNGHVNTNVGAAYNNGGRVYNYTGNFSNHTVTIGSGSFNVGHDGTGNGTLQMNGTIVIYNSGTTTAPTNTWSLPQIPRYANLTFFNQQATDEGIAFQWGSDNNVDYITWWSVAYDGGGHHDTPASGTGPFQIQLHGLRSETTYDITVGIRRADSGLWTNSGTAYQTTLKQANFFPTRVP